MNLEKQLELHEKAIAILEMIQAAQKRYQIRVDNLQLLKRMELYDGQMNSLRRDIDLSKRTILRLRGYYKLFIAQMFE